MIALISCEKEEFRKIKVRDCGSPDLSDWDLVFVCIRMDVA